MVSLLGTVKSVQTDHPCGGKKLSAYERIKNLKSCIEDAFAVRDYARLSISLSELELLVLFMENEIEALRYRAGMNEIIHSSGNRNWRRMESSDEI